MRISDWSSDVCSSDLGRRPLLLGDLRTVCVRATRPLTLEQTLAPQPHEDRHRRRVRQAPGCTERIMDVSRCERSAVSPEDAETLVLQLTARPLCHRPSYCPPVS